MRPVIARFHGHAGTTIKGGTVVIQDDAVLASSVVGDSTRLASLRDLTNKAFAARTIAIADPTDPRVADFLVSTQLDHAVLAYLGGVADATSLIARAALEDFLECAVTNQLLDGAMSASQRVDHMIKSADEVFKPGE